MVSQGGRVRRGVLWLGVCVRVGGVVGVAWRKGGQVVGW